MAVYWCTEALPLSVTALLPIILFPFLGVLPSHKVCPQYFLDTNFLFLSGLIMASAIEEWNLHRRIALKILMLVGVQPARLILGMMVTTSFLSMWLSNTASTAMMLPIASAILKSLFGPKEARKDPNRESEEYTAALRRSSLRTVPTEMQFLASTEDKDCTQEVEVPLDLPADSKKEEEYRRNIWKGFLISIPYSASIGGTATLTGTAPNLILLGQLKSFFPQCDVVNFGSWFIFAFPLMLLFLVVGWLWISFLYGGISLRGWRKKSELRSDAENRARAVIREEFQNLGPIKFLSDAVTGVAIVTILFFFPSQRPSFKWWFDFKAPNTETEPLLTWKKAQDTVPWNIILLLGGGFAMAKGCEESGLSAWIGGQLHPLENVPPALAVLLITVVIAFFTEFASNTATIIIFLPVLAELVEFLACGALQGPGPAAGCLSRLLPACPSRPWPAADPASPVRIPGCCGHRSGPPLGGVLPVLSPGALGRGGCCLRLPAVPGPGAGTPCPLPACAQCARPVHGPGPLPAPVLQHGHPG
ncbi:PREDICTED: solute carrier family 13 member 3 isoform X1 [Condylura cristata]|uniref:solute carrier family 13 member 3 isoform X1 n=1 Tax=Condylura cristata TaxID=143302 RepID=UPI0006429DAE|nr:PREDICTED: solute carrier family 13 member 3 isoform X1 [Condylura cristata]